MVHEWYGHRLSFDVCGTKLLKSVMDKYRYVYLMELLTDNTEKTKAFYRSVGFTASDDMGCVAFIRM